MTIFPVDNRRTPSLLVQGLSTSKPIERVVLLGGGHAHAQVIRALNEKSRPKHLQVTLIDVQRSASYSGMVPGCIAKAYTHDQTQLQLESLAEWAGIEFIQDEVVDIDLEQNQIMLKNTPSRRIPFDVCSIDIGSASRGLHETPGAREYTIPTRPISKLVQRIENAEMSMTRNEPVHVVVIGGGAAGIELSMSIHGRWRPLLGKNLQVTLLDSGSELLPGESMACRQKLRDIMDNFGIHVQHHCNVQEITEHTIYLSGGKQIRFDHCIWATGAGAHPLAYRLQKRGLAVTDRGWIRVNRSLQSLSHPRIFAAGDCSSMEGLATGPPPKAGVYAVRAGPVLIDNLTGFLQHKGLRQYEPQDDFLKLIVCGDGTALGFRFGIPIHGKWVFQLKNSIDVSFMNLFKRENLPDLEEGAPYDTSQYDHVKPAAKRERLAPQDAAFLLQRTDDDVDYREAQSVLRDMTTDEEYREGVLSYMEVPALVGVE